MRINHFDSESLITTLVLHRDLSDDALIRLLDSKDNSMDEILFAEADRIRREHYGDAVYLRGLIEFTNYCKNNCYYCGIRADNRKLQRYRLDKETILACCREGYELGYRTFVLQGGEDPYFAEAAIDCSGKGPAEYIKDCGDKGPAGEIKAGGGKGLAGDIKDCGDARLCDLVSTIHDTFPDCAVTLSVGERSRESYQRLFDAGARRYLLRHEAASAELYGKLHPAEMSLENRMRCLYDLKEIGYQVGAGLMVGAPGQTAKHLIEDLRFMQKLQPDMIGIGPYLPHADTPFGALKEIGPAEAADSSDLKEAADSSGPAEAAASSGFKVLRLADSDSRLRVADSDSRLRVADSDSRLRLTLRLLAILRIMFPYALIPATTALGTIDPQGRVLGLKAGANVIMPNLSPTGVRDSYAIYDNKLHSGEESAQGKALLEKQVTEAGYRIVTDIGDVKR